MEKTTMNVWIMLFFAFAIQSFVLAVLFFVKRKGDRVANSILGIYLLLFTHNLLFNCVYWSRYQHPLIEHLSFTNFIPWVSYGPLLFIYIKRVLRKNAFTWKDWQHALPLLWVFWIFGRFYILPIETKIELAETNTFSTYVNWWPIPRRYMIYAVMSIMFYYAIRIYGLYKNHKEEVTEPQRVWTKTLWWCFTGYSALFFIYFVLIYLGLLTISNDYLIGYGIVFFVGTVSYFSFMQPNIFSGKMQIPFAKYRNNGLSSAMALEMKDELLLLMEEEQLYLDSSLTLDVLADKLNLSRHHTSQLINEYFRVNYFEFVNNYRIDEAIRLLQDENNDLNINQIIYTTGFNNRTSFYNAFKKKTGVSPKSYKEQYG